MNIVEAFNKLKEDRNLIIQNKYMKITYDNHKYYIIYDEIHPYPFYRKEPECVEIKSDEFMFCLEDVLACVEIKSNEFMFCLEDVLANDWEVVE